VAPELKTILDYSGAIVACAYRPKAAVEVEEQAKAAALCVLPFGERLDHTGAHVLVVRLAKRDRDVHRVLLHLRAHSKGDLVDSTALTEAADIRNHVPVDARHEFAVRAARHSAQSAGRPAPLPDSAPVS
jgi:hypothetical protein